MGYGTITAYALMSLEPRGILFVKPGMEVFVIYFLFLQAFAEKCVDEDNIFHYSMLFGLQFNYCFLHLQAYDGMIIGEHSRDTDLDVSYFYLII